MIILIQGSVSHYTLDTYFYYKEQADVYVYLSTWKEDFNTLEDSRKQYIKKEFLVLCDKPNHLGRHNVNFQCKSTLEGIKHIAKSYSLDNFVVKTRSDQRFDIVQFKKIFANFFNQNKNFLGIDLYTRRYVPFHLGDMLLTMKLKDHLRYWDYYDINSQDQYDFWQKNVNRFDLEQKIYVLEGGMNIPEVALLYSFLNKKYGIPYDIKEWIDFFNKEVYIVSSNDIRLRSMKFQNNIINKENQIQSTFFSPKHLVASSLLIGCVDSGEILKEINLKELKSKNLKIYFLDIIKVSIKLFINVIKKMLSIVYNSFVYLLKGKLIDK